LLLVSILKALHFGFALHVAAYVSTFAPAFFGSQLGFAHPEPAAVLLLEPHTYPKGGVIAAAAAVRAAGVAGGLADAFAAGFAPTSSRTSSGAAAITSVMFRRSGDCTPTPGGGAAALAAVVAAAPAAAARAAGLAGSFAAGFAF